MGWSFALISKVIGRTNQTFSKVILPDPVGHHTSRKRIILRCNPTGKLQTAGLTFRDIRFFGIEFAQKPARNQGPLVFELSSLQERCITDFRSIRLIDDCIGQIVHPEWARKFFRSRPCSVLGCGY